PGADVMRLAADRYARVADPTWGGVGRQTKFPSRLPIRFLLRYQRRTGDSRALDMATLALDKMAAGGIYDHVGGGFHRYSTEVRWLVPHFEKMLYDNAQLSLAYLEAFQVTGRPEYERIVRETLDYVIREMTSPEGGFYSASDADSIGPSGETEEGYFYTWTPAELDAVLGQELAQTFGAYYGVTEAGNFEGRNILHHWRELARVAKDLGASPDSVRSQLVDARAKLYAARSKRPAPLRDDKILVGWNGLMISSFARAGFVLGEASYTRHAVRAAELILDHGLQENRLRRVLRGTRARGPAFLEDYSFAIAAFLDLYEAAPDPRWIRAAERLQSTLDEHYHDDIGGGYFRSANDHESLIAREKPSRDGALPAGNGVAALNLLRLSEYTQNIAYIESASLLFSAYYDALTQRPTSIAEMLLAVDYQTETTKEIVIVAPSSGADPSAMLAPLRNHYLPSRIVSIVRQGADLEAHAGVVPLVRDKKAQGGAVTAYVCENRVCDAPTTDPAVFAGQISKTARLEFE
ncbi:MAG: thioredoxin domain-containing protein, partial [bacterium]|nr:thioredoxin domain-containing protein [bacterium]